MSRRSSQSFAGGGAQNTHPAHPAPDRGQVGPNSSKGCPAPASISAHPEQGSSLSRARVEGPRAWIVPQPNYEALGFAGRDDAEGRN